MYICRVNKITTLLKLKVYSYFLNFTSIPNLKPTNICNVQEEVSPLPKKHYIYIGLSSRDMTTLQSLSITKDLTHHSVLYNIINNQERSNCTLLAYTLYIIINIKVFWTSDFITQSGVPYFKNIFAFFNYMHASIKPKAKHKN